jgi:hypothetical protein
MMFSLTFSSNSSARLTPGSGSYNLNNLDPYGSGSATLLPDRVFVKNEE